METPRGPLAGGEDEFADPARAPARENPQAAADVRLMPVQDDFIARIGRIGIADDDRVLRLPRPHRGDALALPAVAVLDLIGRTRPADVELRPGHRAIRVAHGNVPGRPRQESNPPRLAIPERLPGLVGGEVHLAPRRPGINIADGRLL